MIEHTTDLVSFLQSARRLLKDEGVVILAAPDKRKCFDFFRPLSSTGDAIVAFQEKRQRHTAKTHFDNAMYTALRNSSPGWHIAEQSPAVLTGAIENGLSVMERAHRSEYVDAHNWTFTPSSFELMVLELRALGLLQLSIERCEEAPYTEFYAWLRPCEDPDDPKVVNDYRLGLLNRIVVEQAEASKQVVGSPWPRQAEDHGGGLSKPPGWLSNGLRTSHRCARRGRPAGSTSEGWPRHKHPR